MVHHDPGVAQVCARAEVVHNIDVAHWSGGHGIERQEKSSRLKTPHGMANAQVGPESRRRLE